MPGVNPDDPATQAELAKRMLDILNQTGASRSIIRFAEKGLHKHRRLKRARFKVPLTDKDGTVYEFSYSSDAESDLYILSYRFRGKL